MKKIQLVIVLGFFFFISCSTSEQTPTNRNIEPLGFFKTKKLQVIRYMPFFSLGTNPTRGYMHGNKIVSLSSLSEEDKTLYYYSTISRMWDYEDHMASGFPEALPTLTSGNLKFEYQTDDGNNVFLSSLAINDTFVVVSLKIPVFYMGCTKEDRGKRNIDPGQYTLTLENGKILRGAMMAYGDHLCHSGFYFHSEFWVSEDEKTEVDLQKKENSLIAFIIPGMDNSLPKSIAFDKKKPRKIPRNIINTDKVL